MANLNTIITRDRIIIICLGICIFLLLGLTGTLTSGYHFVDDHQIIRIDNELESSSLITVISGWIKYDIQLTRFRPVYQIHRGIETWILGSNMLLWKIYTGLLASISMICFYLGMRNLKFTSLESLVFVLMAFVGPQMAIWWRLGPNETIGITFLGLAFLFMTRCIKGKYNLNTVLFTIFITLSSLCKESILVIIPAFILFKIWYEKTQFNIPIYRVIIRNYLLLIPVVGIFISIIIILIVAGGNGESIGVTRIDKNISSQLYNMYRTAKVSFHDQGLAILGIITIQYLMLRNISAFGAYARRLFLPLIFCLLIVLPNLFLYANSGIWERYYLPSSIGIAFLIISLINKTEIKLNWLKYFFIAVILFFCIGPLYDSIRDARKFAVDGQITNELLSVIMKAADDDTDILVVAPVAYWELSMSLDIYLTVNGKNKVFAHSMPKDSNNGSSESLTRLWLNYFKGRHYNDLNNPPEMIVFLDTALIHKFFETQELDSKMYSNVLDPGYSYALLSLQGNAL